jgi:hypothetical protein
MVARRASMVARARSNDAERSFLDIGFVGFTFIVAALRPITQRIN